MLLRGFFVVVPSFLLSPNTKDGLDRGTENKGDIASETHSEGFVISVVVMIMFVVIMIMRVFGRRGRSSNFTSGDISSFLLVVVVFFLFFASLDSLQLLISFLGSIRSSVVGGISGGFVDAFVKFSERERTMSVVFMRSEKVRKHFNAASVEQDTSAKAQEHTTGEGASLIFDAEADGDTNRDGEGEEGLETEGFPEGELGRDGHGTDGETFEDLVEDEDDGEGANISHGVGDTECGADDNRVDEDTDFHGPELDQSGEMRFFLGITVGTLEFLELADTVPVDFSGRKEDDKEGNHGEEVTEGVGLIVIFIRVSIAGRVGRITTFREGFFDLEEFVSGFLELRDTMRQQVNEDGGDDNTDGDTGKDLHSSLDAAVLLLAVFFIVILGRDAVGDQVGSDGADVASNEDDEDGGNLE